ncbi:MAG: hypothetical protein ACI4DX_06035 [Oliverpabstia sp.]
MKDRWYVKLLSLLKLETTSFHGRINLAGELIIAMFCLIYSANDVVRHIISAVEDVAKTIALGVDVYHEYESPNVVGAVLPTLLAFILCLIFLAWHERRKK